MVCNQRAGLTRAHVYILMDGVRAATAHNEFWKRAGKQNLPASSVDLFYFGVSSSSVSAGAQSENPTTSRVARVIILIISAQICAKNLRALPEWQKCVEKCTQVAGGGGEREGAGVLIHRSADSAFIFAERVLSRDIKSCQGCCCLAILFYLFAYAHKHTRDARLMHIAAPPL